MALSNSAIIVKTMTNFFTEAFEEITSLGLNLKALDTVQTVLSETHILALKSQIMHLKEMEESIDHEIPASEILEDFMKLLTFLKEIPAWTSGSSDGRASARKVIAPDPALLASRVTSPRSLPREGDMRLSLPLSEDSEFGLPKRRPSRPSQARTPVFHIEERDHVYDHIV